MSQIHTTGVHLLTQAEELFDAEDFKSPISEQLLDLSDAETLSEIRKGKVPIKLHELLRGHNPNSSAGIEFQRFMAPIFLSLLPHELRENNAALNATFIAAESDKPFVRFLKSSNPPVFYFGDELFTRVKGKFTSDELVLLLAEQVAHWINEYCHQDPTPLLDAHYRAIEMVENAGFSPLAGLDILPKLAEGTPPVLTDYRYFYQEISPEQRVIDVETALTDLSRKIGVLRSESEPIHHLKPLVKVVKRGRKEQTSSLSKLYDRGEYNSLDSIEKKLNILRTVVKKCSHWNKTNLEEIVELFNDLETLAPIEDALDATREQLDLQDGALPEDLREYVDEKTQDALGEAILSLIDEGEIAAFKTLFPLFTARFPQLERTLEEINKSATSSGLTADEQQELSALDEDFDPDGEFDFEQLDRLLSKQHSAQLNPKPKKRKVTQPPLVKRLKPLADAISKTIRASTAHFAKSAQEVVALAAVEPLLRNDLLPLTTDFELPTFPLSEVGKTVKWNVGLKVALEADKTDGPNPARKFLEAMQIPDWRLYAAKSADSRSFLLTHSNMGAHIALTNTPLAYGEICISKAGKVTKYKAGESFGEKLEDQRLVSLATQFSLLGDEETRAIAQYNLETLHPAEWRESLLTAAHETPPRCIGVRSLAHDPEIFVSFYRSVFRDWDFQNAMVTELRSLRGEDKAQYKQVVQKLCETLTDGFSPQDGYFVLKDKNGEKPEYLQDAPLLQFFAGEQLMEEEVLSAEAVQGVLVSSGAFETLASEELSSTQVSLSLKTLRPLAHSIVPDYPLEGFSDWDQFVEVFQQQKVELMPLAEELVALEAMLLIESGESFVSQDAIGWIAAVLPLESTKYEQLKQQLVDNYQDYEFRDFESFELGNVIRNWKAYHQFGFFLNDEDAYQELDEIIVQLAEIPDPQFKRTLIEEIFFVDQQYRNLATPIFDPDRSTQLMQMWSDAAKEELGGVDTKKQSYHKAALAFAKQIQKHAPLPHVEDWLAIYADTVESQRYLSADIGQLARSIGSRVLDNTCIPFHQLSIFRDLFKEVPPARNTMFVFLYGDGDEESIEQFATHFFEQYREQYRKCFETAGTLTKVKFNGWAKYLHKSFWSETVDRQLSMMSQLFLPSKTPIVGDTNPRNTRDELEEKLATAFVLEHTYPLGREMALQSRPYIEAFIDSASEKYQRYAALALLLVTAKDRSKDSDSKIGASFARTGKESGPGFTYYIQQLQSWSSDGIPKAFRDGFRQINIKTDVGLPPRWEQMEWIYDTISPQLADDLKHIGKVRGSGKFFGSWQVESARHKTTILQIQRPKSAELARENFDRIQQMIEVLKTKGHSVGFIETILAVARKGCAIEADVTNSPAQFRRAKEVLDNKTVEVEYNGKVHKRHHQTATLHEWGVNADGNGFRLTSCGEGKHLLDQYNKYAGKQYDGDAAIPEEVVVAALGELFFHTTSILEAKGHSLDPHSGNNVEQVKEVLERIVAEFDFGLFDLAIANADDEELIRLGEKLSDIVMSEGLKRNESIGDALANRVSITDDTASEASVLQAFFALGDYQKVLTSDQITAVLASAVRAVDSKMTEPIRTDINNFSPKGQGQIFAQHFNNPPLRLATSQSSPLR